MQPSQLSSQATSEPAYGTQQLAAEHRGHLAPTEHADLPLHALQMPGHLCTLRSGAVWHCSKGQLSPVS